MRDSAHNLKKSIFNNWKYTFVVEYFESYF